MKQFFKSFLAAFLCASSFIWAIHNYKRYVESFDRCEAEVRKNKAYGEYLPILQEQIAAMTSSNY